MSITTPEAAIESEMASQIITLLRAATGPPGDVEEVIGRWSEGPYGTGAPQLGQVMYSSEILLPH
jgi:hypothetical protein